MARETFDLIDGLKIGEVTHTTVVIRESNYGDLLDAAEESEKPVPVINAAGELVTELIASPTLVAANTLRRQIVSIGDISGPLDLATLKRLSNNDQILLQEKCDALDRASLEVTLSRGRDRENAAGTGSGGGDTGKPS